MKIGFDVSQTAEDKAGCGFFADQLIRSLAAQDQENNYLLYPTFYSYRHPEFQKVTIPKNHKFKLHFKGLSFKEMVNGWENSMENRWEWLGSPDIIHSNNFSCIKDHRSKLVYTLYDLTPLTCPEFLFEQNRIICFDGLFNASIYADQCIAISENTKKDFLHYFPHYPADRITVIPLGIRPGIKKITDIRIKQRVLKKFDINAEDEFWLSVGTIEPRKNFPLLVDAFSELKENKKLIIAGGEGWLESKIGEKIKSLGLDEKVIFTGYVSDIELSVLYSSCFAFIYPSFYEGFGLPVLEAMSCGAAIITSNTSSLPEVGGDAALYISPYFKEELVQQMQFLCQNPQKRLEHKKLSIIQSQKFSWNDAAKLTLKAYNKTINEVPFF